LRDSQADVEKLKIVKPKEKLPELRTNAEILAYTRKMQLKKKKEKEAARRKRKREQMEYLAMLEKEEQNMAYENNKNNMEYLAFLKGKNEKKGQALLYDMDTSDRNSSRMTAARSITSNKSYKKKKSRMEDVKNPIEKLTIMMERIKNSKAANEDYRKKIMENQQARLQNMRANLE